MIFNYRPVYHNIYPTVWVTPAPPHSLACQTQGEREREGGRGGVRDKTGVTVQDEDSRWRLSVICDGNRNF